MCDLDELADSEASESVIDTESVKRILESELPVCFSIIAGHKMTFFFVFVVILCYYGVFIMEVLNKNVA